MNIPATSPAHGFWPIALLACLAALTLTFLTDVPALPVLGPMPILPATLLAAAFGWLSLTIIARGALASPGATSVAPRSLIRLSLMGVVLALPPIAIDLTLPFPREMNLPLPGALAFYPAIALVAESVFHLLPLAILSLALPRTIHPVWLLAPVALVEPLFQVAFLSGPPLQGWLVLANVGLISAVQLWAFERYGFGAMITIRLAFYAAWHILWGTARLAILF